MITFVKQAAARLFEPAQRNEHFERRVMAFGVVAVIGFPLYYNIWSDVFPQPYENLPLRLVGSALFLPIVFARYWPPSAKKILPYYWQAAILFALPFFFTFMLLKNNGSNVWVESTLAAVFLMIVLLDWSALIVHFILGAGLAWLAYALTTNGPQAVFNHPEFLPIILFAVVLGTVSNYTMESVRIAQEHAMLATAGSIAHELRTPLLGIRAGAAGLRTYLPTLIDAYRLALESKLPVRAVRAAHLRSMAGVLNRIESEANYSNTIIDMLIANVRLSGPADGKLVECSMTQCVDAALQRYPFSGKERGLVSWERGEEFFFRGSELLMVHVLFNLLKNALRHIARSAKGAITIRLESSSRGNRLIFRDTGSGVPAKVLPHIFTRFYSFPGASDAVLGSGIGLAFCRDVMQSFGGAIECRSVPGDHTEFILTFARTTR